VTGNRPHLRMMGSMAKRPIIRYGDSTTHDGTVVGADPTYSIYGKNVARVGDLVVCCQEHEHGLNLGYN
jgi:uncharacterized Zn-binding protein involved in type VI secretion